MRFKLDENFDVRLVPILAEGGHEADTVVSEGLAGCADSVIYETCCGAGWTLVTLDLDFSNPIRFPPARSRGIIVLRPPRAVLSAIQATLVSAMKEIKSGLVEGKLWIIEPGRIRVFDPAERP